MSHHCRDDRGWRSPEVHTVRLGGRHGPRPTRRPLPPYSARATCDGDRLPRRDCALGDGATLALVRAGRAVRVMMLLAATGDAARRPEGHLRARPVAREGLLAVSVAARSCWSGRGFVGTARDLLRRRFDRHAPPAARPRRAAALLLDVPTCGCSPKQPAAAARPCGQCPGAARAAVRRVEVPVGRLPRPSGALRAGRSDRQRPGSGRDLGAG